MIKNALYVIAVIVVFFYIARTTIVLRPFKVQFENIWGALGFLFLILALICLMVSGYKIGNLDGYRDGVHDMLQEVNKRLSQQQKDK